MLVNTSNASVLVLFKHPDAFIIADMCTFLNSLHLSAIGPMVAGDVYTGDVYSLNVM